MTVLVFVLMLVFVTVTARMAVVMIVREVDIEFRAFDLKTFCALCMQVITVKMKLFEFVLELVEINAEVEHRANEHIAADAAEDVQIYCFHSMLFVTLTGHPPTH
jgi:hypothetical protein